MEIKLQVLFIRCTGFGSDKAETVVVWQAKGSLDQEFHFSIIRRTEFSVSNRLPALDRFRLYFKMAGVKLCRDPNVSLDEKPARGLTPFGRHFFIPPKMEPKGSVFLGGAGE